MLDQNCIDSHLIARANRTARALAGAGLRVVTAESCTAGLVSTLLAQTKYAGEILAGGFVVYSKSAKTRMLQVDADLLQSIGAVNAQVAGKMCLGALANSGADIAIAITGVLGPDPDTDNNPVGLIHWACARGGRPVLAVSKNYGPLGHDALMRHAVSEALLLLEATIS